MLIFNRKKPENIPVTQAKLKEVIPEEFDDNFIIFGDDPKRVEALKESESKELWKAIAIATMGISGRDNITYTDFAVKCANEIVDAFEKRWPK